MTLNLFQQMLIALPQQIIEELFLKIGCRRVGDGLRFNSGGSGGGAPITGG